MPQNRLTQKQQMALLQALSPAKKAMLRRECRKCQMQGTGIKDMLAKLKKKIGPVASLVGPVVFKQFILPMLIEKATGFPPQGRGLALAGQRGRRPQRGRGKTTRKKKSCRC
jgi:hypothetical protein